MPVGVERMVAQSPKPIREPLGVLPADTHPCGAHSTPAPATRDGATARPIQPLRRASLATVVVRKTRASFVMTRDSVSRTTERRGRSMAPPVRPRPRTVGASPALCRALCKEIPRPCRDAEPATPLAGLTYRVRTGVHPRDGILPPSDARNDTPVFSGCLPVRPRTCGWGNPGAHAREDVIPSRLDPGSRLPDRVPEE